MPSTTPPDSALPPAARNPDTRVVAAIVASALFMQNLDSTVVATALPSMARDLGEDPLTMGVAITSYLVALTVFIPLSGWMADRFGAKQVFMAAIATFTVASALCGLSQGLLEMVAARVLQGLGGAMMVPVGRLLLLRRVRKDELLTATTWLSMPALLGPVMGPPVGGFLTDLVSWRAVFWINLPVGLLGLLLVWRLIPTVPRGVPPPPDVPGLAMVGTALACLMFTFETLGRGLVPGGLPEAVLVVGLVLGTLAVRHCRRVPNPAMDFSLFSIPSFSVTVVAGTFFRIGAGMVPFLVPLSLQLGFGNSASQSGLISFATALGAFVMKPMAQFALRLIGFRNVLVWNAVASAVMVGACAAFRPGWPVAALFMVLLVGGLFRSLHFTTTNTLAYAEVPHPKLSAATSFYSTAQQLSTALGVAVAAAVLQASVSFGGRASPAPVDFSAGFLIGAALMLVSAPLAWKLPPEAGEGIVTGRRRG